ncbi:MAG: hypothetical protein NTW49_12570 [Bacteroidia bacterium]|nr:hypothetical protein [Bacteroidia bacterium]
MNQVLISISPKDFSFIAEENLSRIFALFATYHIKANLMQNSAISFSVCLDYEQRKTDQLISDLSLHYKLLYNTGVELVTIRHYTDESVNNILKGRTVLLEQKSRLTAQFVTK